MVTSVIFLVIGLVLVGSGFWIIIFSKKLRTTSDIMRVFIFGWVGAAFLRLFFKPRENEWVGWQKNLLGILFLIVGIGCLYAFWIAREIGL